MAISKSVIIAALVAFLQLGLFFYYAEYIERHFDFYLHPALAKRPRLHRWTSAIIAFSVAFSFWYISRYVALELTTIQLNDKPATAGGAGG